MQQKQFYLTINNKAEFEKNYLPFIKGGGIFIATNEVVELQETVAITLNCFEKTESLTWQAPVVFINPPYANALFPAGFGVMLDNAAREFVCELG